MSEMTTVGQAPKENRTFVWVRRTWLVLTISSGVTAAILLDGDENRDVDLLLALAMLVLCLPSSLLAMLVYAPLSDFIGDLARNWSAVERMGIPWGFFFLFGFLQWYVLFPWLLRKRLKP